MSVRTRSACGVLLILAGTAAAVMVDGRLSRLFVPAAMLACAAFAWRQAGEAARLKGRFLANMSHEIRTPIHGVLGMTELLLCSRLDAEQREYAESVRRSAQHLLGLTSDILDLAKIEVGQLVLDAVLFDLWSVVEEAAGLAAYGAYAKNLELTCLIEPEVPRLVLGDPARLRQVLDNLIRNAIKFTERGEIGIRVAPAGSAKGKALVKFQVTDTGIGIAPGLHETVFESFVQGDGGTTRRYGGSGLGLAISRHLAERMGGRIGFSSRQGEGSTFWFTIALEKQPGPEAPAETPNPFAGLRVLVVQAEPAGRTILSRYLQSWGCRTGEAARSEEAIARLLDAARQGDPFRVALIDLQMRDRSALGLAQAVKLEPAIKNTVLMAVLPPALSPESIRLRESGFAAHVPKPIRPSRLYGGLLELFRPALLEELPPEQPEGGRSPRVLLAEDNAINQKIVSRLLEKNGCKADLVSNGREAVEAAAARRYDLILMDVQMPEVDGFAATEQIRRLEAGIRHTPIAAMTANAMTGDRERCLAAGMDDYISKPVRLKDLERTLERWLG